VPNDVYTRYDIASGQKAKEQAAFDKALDDFVKSSSPANTAALETEENARAAAMDELRSARQAAIDHFSPADRAAWEAAHAATDSAQIERTLAEEELRDARAALDNLPLPILLKNAR
jgi:hypothetical protein